MAGLFAVFGATQGPDGNGILFPDDPALGGHSGTAVTAANTATAVLCTGGFVPPDAQVTVLEAVVTVKTPQTGQPTAGGSFKLKGTFVRNGNTVTQTGSGSSTLVELVAALGLGITCRLTVDTTASPNQITAQVQGALLGPALAWKWVSGPALSF